MAIPEIEKHLGRIETVDKLNSKEFPEAKRVFGLILILLGRGDDASQEKIEKIASHCNTRSKKESFVHHVESLTKDFLGVDLQGAEKILTTIPDSVRDAMPRLKAISQLVRKPNGARLLENLKKLNKP